VSVRVWATGISGMSKWFIALEDFVNDSRRRVECRQFT